MMTSFPLVTAHTGCMKTAENSLESVQAGLALGADIIEDDIRVTRDGRLVLSHDDNVLLSDGQMGSVSRLTAAELREQTASPLVALDQVLPLVMDADRMMNLDIKSDACISPLSEQIERLGINDRVFLTGCQYRWAQQVTACNPRLRKLLNADAQLFKNSGYEEAARQTCEHARDAGCFGINLSWPLVRPELLELAAEYQLDVYVWTVDDEAEMRQFAKWGVHSITTRRVDVLMELKRELLNRNSIMD